MQYPPGTGFVLALFPPGFQVIPLYVLATVIIFGFALLGISYARSTSSIFLTAAFGCLAIYLMINPAKASYSVAPTMVACALAGFLTARLFLAEAARIDFFWPGCSAFSSASPSISDCRTCSVGRIFAVLLRLASCASRTSKRCCKAPVRRRRSWPAWRRRCLANAINAGSPFATTYGGADVTPA